MSPRGAGREIFGIVLLGGTVIRWRILVVVKDVGAG